jgi:hypothetical protein
LTSKPLGLVYAEEFEKVSAEKRTKSAGTTADGAWQMAGSEERFTIGEAVTPPEGIVTSGPAVGPRRSGFRGGWKKTWKKFKKAIRMK